MFLSDVPHIKVETYWPFKKCSQSCWPKACVDPKGVLQLVTCALPHLEDRASNTAPVPSQLLPLYATHSQPCELSFPPTFLKSAVLWIELEAFSILLWWDGVAFIQIWEPQDINRLIEVYENCLMMTLLSKLKFSCNWNLNTHTYEGFVLAC